VRPFVTWEEDLVRGRTGFADGSHGGLDASGPFVDVDVVLGGDVSVEFNGWMMSLRFGGGHSRARS
jgi:hypothetical protein